MSANQIRGVQQAPIITSPGAEVSSLKTWSVDKNNKVITLDNGYTLTFEGKEQAWHIKDSQGNEVRIWGDPHVYEDDGGKWDFKAQTTFQLEDGTKITIKTKPIGDGSMTVSDELFITKGDQSVHVSGIADNNVNISDVSMEGQRIDQAIDDGYLVKEMGGVDDWSFGNEEITHNLPFVDYETYIAGLNMYTTPPSFEIIDLNNKQNIDIDKKMEGCANFMEIKKEVKRNG